MTLAIVWGKGRRKGGRQSWAVARAGAVGGQTERGKMGEKVDRLGTLIRV